MKCISRIRMSVFGWVNGFNRGVACGDGTTTRLLGIASRYGLTGSRLLYSSSNVRSSEAPSAAIVARLGKGAGTVRIRA